MAKDTSARRRRSTRAFRRLLDLYPGEFRDEYGREMSLVFADRYRDAPTGWQRVRVWIEAVAGVLREAPKEHVRMTLQDSRYAFRLARRSPGFTIAAVVTLALGIGANTAIFQLIDAVGLRTLPVANPHELAEVRIVGGNKGFGVTPGWYGQLTRPVWEEVRANQQAFSGMFAWSSVDRRAGDRAHLRRINAIAVSGDFFNVLGIQPWRGRFFGVQDETSCPTSRVVVSHGYWQRTMGGAEMGGNTRLLLNLEAHEVIGVTPPGFFGLAVGESFDVAVPMCRPGELRRELFDVSVMGRLRPGWTLERASAHLDALSAGIFEATSPPGYSTASIEKFKEFRMSAYSAASGVSRLRQQYETSLGLLLGITGLVLLIACANLANLMMARASARAREVAVRLALGASRPRLLRQFVVESALLAFVGAVAGMALAQVLSRVLVWAISGRDAIPALAIVTDWRTLLFTAFVAGATCLVFGVAPAVRATQVDLSAAMTAGGRSATAGRERLAPQRLLVVTQVAVSMVLLVGAFLFVGSFRNLITSDPGMRQKGVIVGYVFRPTGVLPERVNDFHRGLVAEMRTLPGIANVGTTSNVPLLGASWTHGVRVGAREGSSRFTWISPEYLDTMNIRVIEGRDFTLHDTRSTARVAIVNQAFVRQYIEGRAIGQTLRTSPEPNYPATVYEIVGVVPDTAYNDLRNESQPMAFAPDSQHPRPGFWPATMIQSTVEPAAAIATVTQWLARAHPDVVAEFDVFQWRVRDGLVRERLLAMLAGFFGGLAALLAMVGLYGMISYTVAERRREIGVRVALGAQRRQVVAMMMREAGALLAAGLVAGTVLALLATQTTSSLLFGLKPHDPLAIGGACLLLTFIGALASFIPARAASRLDPLTALRQD